MMNPGRDYGERWREVMAPRTGDVRRELTLEASEYLGIPFEEAERRVEHSGKDFPEEWKRLVSDPRDPEQVVRFYSESKAELFEQIAWHSTEAIHHRAFVAAEIALRAPGREFLDFGSGIGSNALVFGLSGFAVTLADVADPLLGFARWRCEKRGIRVRAVDLKRESLGVRRADVVTCFDVLEHVPEPVFALKQMRDALRPGGIFFVYAPIGHDPDRPMHVVHDASVLQRIRSLGFAYRGDWEAEFPGYFQPPSAYQRVDRSRPANWAYLARDVWFSGRLADAIARLWRRWSPSHVSLGTRSAVGCGNEADGP
jgi:2-polyprenyl-3-methyl-5-hydroxy-6-metoxy-1,4-benzoquinol methylase